MSAGHRVFSQQQTGDDSYIDGGDADLSLSELSLNEKPVAGPSHRFSLLARPLHSESPKETEEDDVDVEASRSEETDQDTESWQRSVARSREERLRQDLFVLQKLNASLSLYNNALGEVETSNEVRTLTESSVCRTQTVSISFGQRAAMQLQRTDALLNKYISILEKSEAATKLIFDERWRGAEEVSLLSTIITTYERCS